MAIRNSITAMRTAVTGTLAFDGPQRAVALVLDTTTEANNVFGRAFTYKTEDTAAAGGAGVFAGIMTNPHAYAVDRQMLACQKFGVKHGKGQATAVITGYLHGRKPASAKTVAQDKATVSTHKPQVDVFGWEK